MTKLPDHTQNEVTHALKIVADTFPELRLTIMKTLADSTIKHMKTLGITAHYEVTEDSVAMKITECPDKYRPIIESWLEQQKAQ